MNRRRYAAVFFGVLAVLWLGVLFFFSGQSGVDSRELSMKVARRLLEWFPWIGMTVRQFNPILRKIAHAGVFGVEGALSGLCLLNALPMGWGCGLSVAMCAIVATANEYHQTFSQGRSAEIQDALIDFGGALLGIAVATALIAIARAWSRRANFEKT